MAENQTYQDDEQKSPLDAIMSPLTAGGIDPDAVRANPSLFPKLAGGGIGMPNNPTPPTVTPSAVSTSGQPASSRPSYDSLISPDKIQQEMDEEAKLQADRQKNAAVVTGGLRDSSGKVQQEYRPTIGQRVVRGLEAFARGGTSGALNADYGAPNKQGQNILRQASGQVASDDQALTERARRFKELRESATGASAIQRGQAAEDRANRPTFERVVDDKGNVRYVTPEQANSGNYKDPITYNAENKADKAPTNYEQTVIAAENETDPNGPLHRAAQQMRDTEVRKFKAGNSGRQPTETELWAQAFQSEYGRKPNAEEIASRKVSGGGTAGGAAARPKNVPDRASSADKFETHWQNTYFKPMERKYDSQRTAVEKNQNLSDSEKQAEYDRIEGERAVAKQDIQDRKNEEAEKYQVYGQPGGQPAPEAAPAPARATPTAVSPSGAPKATTQNQGRTLDKSNQQDLAMAHRYLEKAGGDKNKARELAKKDGYNL